LKGGREIFPLGYVHTSFIKDINSGSCAAVIRNDKGQFTLSAWDVIPFFLRAQKLQNSLPAHELAKLNCGSGSGGLLQGTMPPCVLELALLICNQNTLYD
jgi:hypothetical protein